MRSISSRLPVRPVKRGSNAEMILGHRFLGVALRVDRDEIDLELVGVGPERLHQRRHVVERRRADVGTERVAEEHRRRVALQRRLGYRRPVLVHKAESATADQAGDQRPIPAITEIEHGADRDEENDNRRPDGVADDPERVHWV